MSTTIKKSLGLILECPICQERLQNAKSLSCGHTFCKECLSEYVKSKVYSDEENAIREVKNHQVLIECPCCRRDVWVKRNVNDQTPGLLVNNIVDALEDDLQPGPSNMCDKHTGNEKKFVCEKCKMCICSECAITDHFDHGSRPKTFKEIHETMTRLQNQSADWVSDRIEFESKVDYLRQQGAEALDTLEEDMLTSYAICASKLTDAQERMSAYIHEQKRGFHQQIDSLLQEHQESASDIARMRSQATRRMSRGGQLDIIKAYTGSAKRLANALDKSVPSTTEIERDVNGFRDLHFENPDSRDTKHFFGRIARLRGDGDIHVVLIGDNDDGDNDGYAEGSDGRKRKRLESESDDDDGMFMHDGDVTLL